MKKMADAIPIQIHLVILLTASSCASILNSRNKEIDIITTSNARVIFKKDTLSNTDCTTRLFVERSQYPLLIKVFNDSISKNIEIRSTNSFAYWLNVYPWFLPGFFIDKKNPKRYGYPDKIYINPRDILQKYFHYDPRSNKGKWLLQISVPYFNNFLLRPDKEKKYKINSGFFGASLGLDHYYSSKQFINITAGAATDLLLPVPVGVDYFGDHEIMSSSYLGISNNHKIKNIIVGYGLHFSRNNWSVMHADPQSNPTISKTSNAAGFIIQSYYAVKKNFHIGLIYRPTIYQFSNSSRFIYEHLISIDLAWKIKLK